MDNGSSTKRVALSNGQWADLRTKSTVGDVRFQREEAHRRGFDDVVLDGLSLIERLIVEWSYGEVSRSTIDALSEEDAVTLINAQRSDDDRPNPSRRSSAGGRARTKKTASTSAPSNG